MSGQPAYTDTTKVPEGEQAEEWSHRWKMLAMNLKGNVYEHQPYLSVKLRSVRVCVYVFVCVCLYQPILKMQEE